MEYAEMINLSHNAPNQSIEFRTKIWVEINDEFIMLINLI